MDGSRLYGGDLSISNQNHDGVRQHPRIAINFTRRSRSDVRHALITCILAPDRTFGAAQWIAPERLIRCLAGDPHA